MKKHICKLNDAGTRAALSLLVALGAFGASGLGAAPNGAETFKEKCAMCHGADASGDTPMGQSMKIRDLRSSEVQKQSNAELTAIITKGKSPMPAYEKTLSAADIGQLVAYLRSIATKN